MQYIYKYMSPIGGITIAGDGESLTGLWFDGQRYYADTLSAEHEERILPLFEQTKEWLDCYFGGGNPDFMPAVSLNSTPFRIMVWKILQEIPYGKTVTYADIAKEIACRIGIKAMSAQAVGGAVGHNPISIIIPCHRVVGYGGNLTGYSGGITKKIGLLELERVDMSGLYIPTKGSAL